MRIIIISGYFNPFHLGHLKLVQSACKLGDKLIVVVNNDVQQLLKKHKIIMKEQERIAIVKAIRYVDEAVLAIDQDMSIIKTLDQIAQKYSFDKLVFVNGGNDRSSKIEILETGICKKYNIEMMFGVGGYKKTNSSSNINKLNEENLIVKHVFKIWGSEEWLVNNKLYCGKILYVNKNHCCSYHYHKLKDETFYILNGHIVLEIEGIKREMFEGDVIRIKPGTKHRFFAVENSNIIEISTQHFDTDSHRIIESDKCLDTVKELI